MHKRHACFLAIAFLFQMLTTPAFAVNWVCAVDLNGNGSPSDAGETGQCLSLTAGELCPVDVANCTISQTCPINAAQTCSAGSCTDTAACTGSGTSWSCPLAGVPGTFTTQTACNAACTQTAACVDLPPTCPSGPYPCMDNGGTFQCSATTCIDLDATPPVQTAIDDSIYVNDGATDPTTGACLDQIMIFSGRNMRCKESGVQTAFHNCCRDEGQVLNDSSGSTSEAALTASAISYTYDAMAAAYTAYAATGSASAAASAAGNVFIAVDPTTLAISVAIYLVVNYLLTECDQQSMETAMLNSSGYCYQTGNPCIEDWPFFGCVQNAQNYCCFNSKLARIIHEQGRPQLASFNALPPDNCRGFTPEEFQYLDFSKIDLSEYFGDVTSSALVNPADMNTTVSDFYTNLR